jgi:Family of unknown function (DUF6129)
MALGADELTEIERIVAAAEAGASPLAGLRQRFPHLAWTRCDASDVSEVPFKSLPRFDLHLIDGSDHCVQITSNPERATGVVLAARSTKP